MHNAPDNGGKMSRIFDNIEQDLLRIGLVRSFDFSGVQLDAVLSFGVKYRF